MKSITPIPSPLKRRPRHKGQPFASLQGERGSIHALNWLNFFAADVAGGVGPFLAIYLAANRHWKPGPIGVAMSAMGFATVIAQTPAGFMIDKTGHKRTVIVAATAVMGIAGLLMPFFPNRHL